MSSSWRGFFFVVPPHEGVPPVSPWREVDDDDDDDDVTGGGESDHHRPPLPPHDDHPPQPQPQQQRRRRRRRQGVEYTKEALSFGEWRRMNKLMMEVYWDRRMVSEEGDDEDGHSKNNDNNNNDDEEEEEEEEDDNHDWDDDDDEHDHDADRHKGEGNQQDDNDEGTHMPLESQPPLPDSHNRHHNKEGPPRKKPRIPPLDQAIHSVKTLAYLDLTTKEISVDLCRVTKVWRLRQTKRGLSHLPVTDPDVVRQRCCEFPGRMPRTVFGHMQDDGPLGCCYVTVLSLEIEQLTPPISSSSSSPRRYIRIFLYNAYAKAMSAWMQEQHSIKGDKGGASSSYIFSLSRIPAKCILPYALDPRDWWDQEHVLPYCICLGDDSDMLLQDPKHPSTTTAAQQQQQQKTVRMDSAELEIRIAKTPIMDQDDDMMVSEFVLSRTLFRGPPDEGEDFLPGDDQRLLQSWRNYHQTQILPSAPPRGGMSPAVDVGASQRHQQKGGPSHDPPPQQQPMVVAPQPPPPPAIPNFSTVAVPPTATDTPPTAVAASTPRGPTLQAPPHRPPPPSPVHRPVEPMDFGGTTRKRSQQISDVTNLLPHPTTSLRYERMSALLPLYEQSRLATVRQQPVVNLYGIVLGFTVPSQSKRGDWMCHCNIVDETCTVPTTLLIFTREAAHLPQFQRMGDVLRMHRVLVGQWNGGLQLTGRKESSFVVIRRTEDAFDDGDAHWKIEPTASKEYHFETSDEQRAQNLWHWGQKLIERQPTMLHDDNKFTLGNISHLTEEDDRTGAGTRDRDLTVMVTAKIPYPATERTSISAYGFLRVWDGTGQTPSDPLPIPVTLPCHVRLRQGDPPQTAVSKIASILRKWKESHSKDPSVAALQIPESTCGKVANVIIWERHHWDLIEKHVPTGTFLRLRNVDVKHYRDNHFRSLMVHSRSWMTPLPDITYEVKGLLKEHDGRVRRNEYNPASGLLPSSQTERLRTPLALPPHLTNLRLGNGLAAFAQKKQSKLSTAGQRSKKRRMHAGSLYEGIVRLLPSTVPKYEGNLVVYCNTTSIPPQYQCFVTMVDASNLSLPVLVAGAVGDNLFGVPAPVACMSGRRETPFDSNVAWKVCIQAVWKGTKEFFILKVIEQVPPE